jgi:hypothetical protein
MRISSAWFPEKFPHFPLKNTRILKINDIEVCEEDFNSIDEENREDCSSNFM